MAAPAAAIVTVLNMVEIPPPQKPGAAHAAARQQSAAVPDRLQARRCSGAEPE
jgi:hypothetical protein